MLFTNYQLPIIIAITADIEKAFLMIGINHRDRNLLHFLWLKEPDNVNV